MCKIASTMVGAEALLDEKFLIALSAMDVFNNHPTVAVFDARFVEYPIIFSAFQKKKLIF